MKVLIALDSFKGSLSSLDAGKFLLQGLSETTEATKRDAGPIVEGHVVPLADGGEGTVAAMMYSADGKLVRSQVEGPLGDQIEAEWGLYTDLLDGKPTAVIEMASASGLPMVPKALRNPLVTSTYGVGTLIREAMQAGAKKIIVGLGGSATNDAGSGMLQAMGFELLDSGNRAVARGNRGLRKINRIVTSPLASELSGIEIIAASDVKNPLLGPNGCSVIYGPQKGAGPEMVAIMDHNIAQFANLTHSFLGRDLSSAKGAGAAGGLGFALMAYLGATVQPGFDLVSRALRLQDHVENSDWIVTGEGKLDKQTLFGKGPFELVKMAQKYSKKCIGVGGIIDGHARDELENYFHHLLRISPEGTSVEESMRNAPSYLRETGTRIGKLIRHASA